MRAAAQARQKLGKRTAQRTTPVADHQANGAAERAVQTVRRLANCLLLHFEEKHGRLPPDADLRAWAHSHASFVYNRFHVVTGINRTPFELAFSGKAFDKKICVFGEVVFGKTQRSFKGEGAWVPGMWVGMSEHNGMDYLMSEYGFLEVTSVRRAAPEFQLPCDELLKKYRGLPWEKGTVEKKQKKRAPPIPVLAPMASVLEPMAAVLPGDDVGNARGEDGPRALVDEAASDPTSSEELMRDPPVRKRKVGDALDELPENEETILEAEVVHQPAAGEVRAHASSSTTPTPSVPSGESSTTMMVTQKKLRPDSNARDRGCRVVRRGLWWE